jgi:hypothetical protein
VEANPTKRRERIARAIRLTVDSLLSHIDGAVKEERNCKSCGSRFFHTKCLQEYAEVLTILCKEMK